MITRSRARSLTALSVIVAASLLVPTLPAAAAASSQPSASRVQVEGPTADALTAVESVSSRSFATLESTSTATGTATLSGTVVDGESTGVADVSVSAFVQTTDVDGTGYDFVATVSTDATGAYSFDALAAGAYELFFQPVAADLAWGWFGGGVSPGAEPVVTLADAESATVADRVLVPAMQVDGAVVSTISGGHLTGTDVVLWGSNGPDGEGVSYFEPLLMNEIDGAPFSFGQLPPGQYLLDATEARQNYRGEWWDNSFSFETADVIEEAGWYQLALTPVIDLGEVGITGASATGSTVTATHNTRSGTTYKYVWYADGKAISGATGKSYRIPSSLQHKQLTVKVTGSKTGYVTSSVTSVPRAKILLTATPTISGKTAIKTAMALEEKWAGYTLTASPGTWTTGARLRYQWYADGRALSGATSNTYKLKGDDRGKRITVKVTGSKDGYGSFSRTSASTNRIALLGWVGMTDEPRVGEMAWPMVAGTFTRDASLTLRIYVGGVLVSTSRYPEGGIRSVPASWVGKRLKATLTVSKPGYTTHVLTSNTSAPVTW